MFWAWLIVAVLLAVVGLYRLGVADIDSSDAAAGFWLIGICSVLWPIVLPAVCVIMLFALPYSLGVKKRELRKKMKADQAKTA